MAMSESPYDDPLFQAIARTIPPREGGSCPRCMDGELERRSHRFSTDRGPNVPDCDWLECDSCDFRTDPE